MLACGTCSFPRFASLVVRVSLIVSAFLSIGMIYIVRVSLIIGPLLLVRMATVRVLARICGLARSTWLSLGSCWSLLCWGSGAPGDK